MKVKILLLACLLAPVLPVFAQTGVSGSIRSTNGELIPIVKIDVAAIGSSDIFSIPDNQFADEGGNYQILFPDPGIYRLTIRALFHKTVTIPLLVFDQQPMEMDINLIPRSFNQGEHFDKQVYTEWIKAYGNFNDYDYFSGEIFRKNGDGSISAYIKTQKDTVRYQVRGISNGSTVLPGADYYNLRDDNSFEAVIINHDKPDSIELRFHPKTDPPYPDLLPNRDFTKFVPLSAFLSFKNPSDLYWIEPLQQMNVPHQSFVDVSQLSFEDLKPDTLSQMVLNSSETWSGAYAVEKREQIKIDLETKELHPQQQAVLLIAYLGLIDRQIKLRSFMTTTDREKESEITLDKEFSDQIITSVDPRHPAWSLNTDTPLLLLEQTEYDTEVVRYAEEMIQQHKNEHIVRKLVLHLIERNAGQFDDILEMNYYNWIVNRYGEGNLARKARVAFQQAQER